MSQLLLDQRNDLFWMIDADFRLVYANNTCLNLIRAVTGVEHKLNEIILVESVGKGITEKWKSYDRKAFEGTNFEIGDVYHTASNVAQYCQIIFKPVAGGDENIFAVACKSRDITGKVKNRSGDNQMINASLDVF